MFTVNKTLERQKLIWKYTHPDSKSEKPEDLSILYNKNGATVVGHLSTIPDITFAENLLYSMSKRVTIKRDEALKSVLEPFGLVHLTQQTMQGRDTLKDFLSLVDLFHENRGGFDKLKLIERLESASIPWPNESANSYLIFCSLVRRCDESDVLVSKDSFQNNHGFELGTSLNDIFEQLLSRFPV
ncbi:hypothetical protein A1QO_04190 [Vibrio genomosp. F10 str. ZF-129]|uniref:Uncharacterized protein n=1 Tax=Vibrio genomosp. F10 str. ZF-129 TaxID=1187848 RepID=A0A1E5BJ22_9VIBR|nr:hypothetical protein [Vibrio genomosp. F10]OEE37312.1 hypothetical protein A1QO_04190 [Vibrio genomosp. F10 str. ZF-129]